MGKNRAHLTYKFLKGKIFLLCDRDRCRNAETFGTVVLCLNGDIRKHRK